MNSSQSSVDQRPSCWLALPLMAPIVLAAVAVILFVQGVHAAQHDAERVIFF